MENIYNLIINIINSTASYSIILSSLLIIVESIIPPLPLGLFVTVLFINHGILLGFLISWISTIIGSVLSFYLFQTIFKNIVDKYIRKYKYIDKFISLIDNIKVSDLVLIIAIPFTPQFVINIAAGISKLELKKFLPAIIIGKISVVLFWGLVGTNLIDSLKDPISLVKVILLVLITYVITKIVNKKYNLDEEDI